ncbi:hypothetical protein L211DRAFT_849326 [Terfezia boudieri ATCC MYA-4762]|uniref:Uncharacterized protein n=1 Tax=Terfezia boudieri ATCC MYA-4762 TaxID=1051890 RepID=A0A3N4LN21_9PEZI|nr:hypothetical protein L211DRAFT_849326 [Terfezia boudieri ATCC MYA-4762]
MQVRTGRRHNDIASSPPTTTEADKLSWDSNDCLHPISAPVQDLGQRVLVHWDRGIDMRSAGPHIMTVLRKIWGAERQLRDKRGTLANRQRSHTTNNSILLLQSLYQTAKWEEILNRYERELDGLVFKRFQLVRVEAQAGKHVPQGAGRVYSKVIGYSLPKVNIKTSIEVCNTNTTILSPVPQGNLDDSMTQPSSDELQQSITIPNEEAQISLELGEAEPEFNDEQDGESKAAAANGQQHTEERQAEEKDSETKGVTAYDYQYTVDRNFDQLNQTLEEASHIDFIEKAQCPKETCIICQAQLPGLKDTHPRLKNSVICLNNIQNMCLLCLGDLWDRYGEFAKQLTPVPGPIAARSKCFL